MRTKVFSYKGWVGIQSDVKAEGLLNKPLDKGQLGFVLDANFVDISPEALELLKKVPLSGDCIGEVDIFKSQKGTIFSWLGGPLKMFQPEKISGSSSYDASLITDTVDVEIDLAFIEAIDKDILD